MEHGNMKYKMNTEHQAPTLHTFAFIDEKREACITYIVYIAE